LPKTRTNFPPPTRNRYSAAAGADWATESKAGWWLPVLLRHGPDVDASNSKQCVRHQQCFINSLSRNVAIFLLLCLRKADASSIATPRRPSPPPPSGPHVPQDKPFVAPAPWGRSERNA